MNIIETSIPAMEKIKSQLLKKTNSLNEMLKDLHLSPISIDPTIEKIQKQIDSANNKFTIAFVGTFKTGKSTIINSLLQLEGDSRLSSEFDPDTAKCIRIVKKEYRQEYDAEVIFQDNIYPTERISWSEAKKYTSQVALDKEGGKLKEKAEKIEEVRYYVDNQFLDMCNILDLPGTGTGTHFEHTEVTDKKIMESDCIFLVVSTDVEPDRETIKNLEKVSTKMLPIINVWQYNAESIYSEFTAEDIRNILLDQYQAYFANAESPVIYYAKEIDMAQQQGRDIEEEWGKAAFFDKVLEILQNAQKGDRLTRIRQNLQNALSECDSVLRQLEEDDKMTRYLNEQKTDSRENLALKARLDKCRAMVSTNIKNQAKQTTDEIIENLISASDSFISNRMFGINFKAFRKKAFEADLKRDFEKNYVRIDSGWVEATVKDFADRVKDIVTGSYSEFSVDLDSNITFTELDMNNFLPGSFITSMAQNMAKDMVQRLLPLVTSIIVGTLLLIIPGGAIIEAVGTVISSGITAVNGLSNEERLLAKQESVKIQSRCEIRQHRTIFSRDLTEEGEKLNSDCHNTLAAEMKKRQGLADDNIKKIADINVIIRSFHDEISEFQSEIKKL